MKKKVIFFLLIILSINSFSEDLDVININYEITDERMSFSFLISNLINYEIIIPDPIYISISEKNNYVDIDLCFREMGSTKQMMNTPIIAPWNTTHPLLYLEVKKINKYAKFIYFSTIGQRNNHILPLDLNKYQFVRIKLKYGVLNVLNEEGNYDDGPIKIKEIIIPLDGLLKYESFDDNPNDEYVMSGPIIWQGNVEAMPE